MTDLHGKSSQEQDQKTLMVRQKISVCASGIWFLARWEIFLARWENFLTHEKKIQKREVQESLSEKKNRDDIDSPPQFGEFQYQLRQVFSTYRVT